MITGTRVEINKHGQIEIEKAWMKETGEDLLIAGLYAMNACERRYADGPGVGFEIPARFTRSRNPVVVEISGKGYDVIELPRRK